MRPDDDDRRTRGLREGPIVGVYALVAVAFVVASPAVAASPWAWAALALAGAVGSGVSLARHGEATLRSRVHLVRILSVESLATGVAFVGLVAAHGLEEPIEGTWRWLSLLGALVLLFVSWALWRRWLDHGGPRHVLPPMFGLVAITLLVVSVHTTLGLPMVAFGLAAALFVMASTVATLALGHLVTAHDRRPWHVRVVAPVGFAAAILFLGVDTGTGRMAMGLLLAVALGGAYAALRPLRDPLRPDGNPLAPYIPWAGAAPSPWRRKHPQSFPLAVPLYLVVSWLLFVPAAVPREGLWVVPGERLAPWVYAIPDLTRDPGQVLVSLVTATWTNHDSVQLGYVTVLLVLFGLVFEHREGPWRTAVVFFVASAAAALTAGILLYAVYPALTTASWAETAWTRTWSGGSAGAFGIMGAFAARARRPWPLLVFFVFWELNVGLWYLRSYTPAFHLPALVVGALLARYGLPLRPET